MAAYNNELARISAIPDLGQYEGPVSRMLSGESMMEDPMSDKEPSEDQLSIRKLMREYQKTDTRTPYQINQATQDRETRFLDYWRRSGGKGPVPDHVNLHDGSFRVFNSAREKEAFMRSHSLNFLREVLRVIKGRKGEGGFDILI
jgi:hypothetical protein